MLFDDKNKELLCFSIHNNLMLSGESNLRSLGALGASRTLGALGALGASRTLPLGTRTALGASHQLTVPDTLRPQLGKKTRPLKSAVPNPPSLSNPN